MPPGRVDTIQRAGSFTVITLGSFMPATLATSKRTAKPFNSCTGPLETSLQRIM